MGYGHRRRRSRATQRYFANRRSSPSASAGGTRSQTSTRKGGQGATHAEIDARNRGKETKKTQSIRLRAFVRAARSHDCAFVRGLYKKSRLPRRSKKKLISARASATKKRANFVVRAWSTLR